MSLIWLIYSLTVGVLSSDAMTSYGASAQTDGAETQGQFSQWTRDDSDQSGGRRLSDGANPR